MVIDAAFTVADSYINLSFLQCDTHNFVECLCPLMFVELHCLHFLCGYSIIFWEAISILMSVRMAPKKITSFLMAVHITYSVTFYLWPSLLGVILYNTVALSITYTS